MRVAITAFVPPGGETWRWLPDHHNVCVTFWVCAQSDTGGQDLNISLLKNKIVDQSELSKDKDWSF